MRLRFTIRDLLWLTLVVALAVRWYVDHRQQSINYVKWMSDLEECRERGLEQMTLEANDLREQITALEEKLRRAAKESPPEH